MEELGGGTGGAVVWVIGGGREGQREREMERETDRERDRGTERGRGWGQEESERVLLTMNKWLKVGKYNASFG